MMRTTRRGFLKGGAAVAGAALAAPILATGEALGMDDLPILETPPSERRGEMLYRTLGRTGERVSVIGLGGAHIGLQKDPQESVRLIRSAVDRGITFLDNSWDYNGGQSEIRMGQALQNGYRDKVFLMTKIDGRTKDAAASQIDESLRRLQTDRLDLLQFHEIIRLEDPDRIFAPGGAWEAAQAAKQAGKLRHIGFTGHKDPLVHRRMLDVAARHGVHFETVQMPINVFDAHFRSFQHDVLPRLAQEKIGVLAMKTFGDHFVLDEVLKSGAATPVELLHYSLSLPVSVVITGIDRPEILDQAIEAARTFQPLTREQAASLLARTKAASADGRYELFKTTPHFDSTAHNPQWLG